MRTLLSLLGFSLPTLGSVEAVYPVLGHGIASWILLTVAIGLPLWYFYRCEGKPVDRQVRRRALVLRLLFAALVALLLVDPKLQVFGQMQRHNQLAVLVDVSRSMSIKEEGTPRTLRAQNVLPSLLTDLEKKTGITPRVYTFAGQVSPLAAGEIGSETLAPVGDVTDITRACSEVAGNLGAANVLAMVCLTDGAHNRGDSPESSLGRLGIPLHFLSAGESRDLTDLSVSLNRPPAIGYLNNQIRVLGEVRAIHVASPSIEVTVLKNGVPFATPTVALTPGQRVNPFSVAIPCDAEGEFTFTFRIPRVGTELSLENNETSFHLRVIKERLEILFVAGRPTFEHGFLRTAARSDPNARWHSRLRIKSDRWLVQENSLPKPPASRLEADLDTIDLVILQGVPAGELSGLAPALAKRIEAGQTGLLILPGDQGLQALAYRDSPLGPLLPFALDSEKYHGTPAAYELPAKEVPLEFLRIREDQQENLDFFRALPRVEGLWQYGAIKPNALLLLNSSLMLAGGPVPLLLGTQFGKGRIAVFMGGPVWPMALRLAPTGKDANFFAGFMVNLLKWLANRHEDAQVAIEMPSARAFVGQPFNLKVWVHDAHRQPVGNALVSGSAIGSATPEYKFDCLPGSEAGTYEVSLTPARRDQLTVEVSAKLSGQPLGSARAQIVVEPPTAEFDDPEVKNEAMARLASMTGGLCAPVAAWRTVVDAIKPTPGTKREQITLDLRDSPLLLLLLLVLPLGEWTLRRLKGLS